MMQKEITNYKAQFWQTTKDGRIQCNLCPRYCRLSNGQRGFCFVRKNNNGEMSLTTYGRSSGFCIDPIEKKPFNHFYPGTSVLSFGTAGCNLGCKFCQNWSISKSQEIDTINEVALPSVIALAAQKLTCKSVAFTYNDPVIFAEYAIDTAKACREIGIKTVIKSAGYITQKARPDFFKNIDAANIDLKSFTDDFYKKLTLSALQPVLDTLIYIKHETNIWLEITNLIIPGANDSEKEIHLMAEWILKNLGPNVPLHFTAFHPDFKMQDFPQTPFETLSNARLIALSHGLNFVYTGNVHDQYGSSTYCPNCKTLLIERDWYQLGKYNLINKNQCNQCGTICPGQFEESHGKWGRKRLPIDIKNIQKSLPN